MHHSPRCASEQQSGEQSQTAVARDRLPRPRSSISSFDAATASSTPASMKERPFDERVTGDVDEQVDAPDGLSGGRFHEHHAHVGDGREAEQPFEMTLEPSHRCADDSDGADGNE
jgi:hypothetical protein